MEGMLSAVVRADLRKPHHNSKGLHGIKRLVQDVRRERARLTKLQSEIPSHEAVELLSAFGSDFALSPERHLSWRPEERDFQKVMRAYWGLGRIVVVRILRGVIREEASVRADPSFQLPVQLSRSAFWTA